MTHAWLVVVGLSPRAPVPASLKVGRKYDVPSECLIGAAAGCHLVLASAEVSAHHCRLEWKYGRWWLLDLGSRHGTFHNGSRVVNVELRVGDTLTVGGIALRFGLGDEVRPSSPDIEAALLSAPDDEQAWQVYGDWLLEHDNELGARINRPLPEDDGRWLGLLAGWWARGYVDVDFFRGLPRRLVVRNPLEDPAPLELTRVLEGLGSDANYRFLRRLELDLESFGYARPLEDVLDSMLTPLASARLPVLEVVEVGPLRDIAPAALHEILDDFARRRSSPIITRTTQWPNVLGLEVLAAPEGIRVTPGPGQWVRLYASRETFIGPETPAVLKIENSRPLSVTPTPFWRIIDSSDEGVRVNGRDPVLVARLRPLDCLELRPGVLVRVGEFVE